MPLLGPGPKNKPNHDSAARPGRLKTRNKEASSSKKNIRKQADRQGCLKHWRGWTQEKRDKFSNTFGVVLEFCFPINEDDAIEADAEEEGLI